MRILFVCTGNTCRSPMAEGLLKNINKEIEVISRGIFVEGAVSASENSILAMGKKGISIKEHIPKIVTNEDIHAADIILTMSGTHKFYIEKIRKENVFTIKEFIGDSGDIKDPYGQGLDEYLSCADELEQIIFKLNEKLCHN